MQTMTNTNRYLWIDPGAAGWVTTLDNDWKIISFFAFKKWDYKLLKEQLTSLKGSISLEKVHALYGSSAKATFQFWYIYWFISACLDEYETYTPKEWQAEVREECDIVLKGNGRKDTKATSLNCANRIFWVDDSYWLATKRSRKPHDWIIDSALIAYCHWSKNAFIDWLLKE